VDLIKFKSRIKDGKHGQKNSYGKFQEKIPDIFHDRDVGINNKAK